MMSLETIEQMSADAAKEAAAKNHIPYVPWDEQEVDNWHLIGCPFPNLGDYIPWGWKRDDEEDWLFCDSSGMGAPGEPALTAKQALVVIKDMVHNHPGCGFAIVRVGQFQLYIARFTKNKNNR